MCNNKCLTHLIAFFLMESSAYEFGLSIHYFEGVGGGGGYMEGKKYMWRKTCFGKNDLSAVLKFINFAS